MNKSEMLAKLQAHGVKISGDKILVANLAEAIKVLGAKTKIKEYELTQEQYETTGLHGRAVFFVEEGSPRGDEGFEAGLNFGGGKPLIKVTLEDQNCAYFLDTPANRKKIEKAASSEGFDE